MASFTQNLNLKKPAGNEAYNVADQNGNMDILDSSIATHLAEDATTNKKGHIQIATNAEVTTGTNTTKAVTPAGVKVELDKKVNKAGDVFTGVISTPRIDVGDSGAPWGQFSAGTNGFVLLGHNCYIDPADGNKIKYRHTHANLGARGIIFRFGQSDGHPMYFDMGSIATTAGATFTPTYSTLFHSGATHLVSSGYNCHSATGDWNNYLNTGFFMGSGLTNSPPAITGANTGFYVTIRRHAERWICQEAMDFNGVGQWVRFRVNGVWGVWRMSGGLITTKPRQAYLHMTTGFVADNWYTVVNITGMGKFHALSYLANQWTQNKSFRITIDGIAHTINPGQMPVGGTDYVSIHQYPFDVTFYSSLRIEVQALLSSAGSNNITAGCTYSLV